MVSINLFAPKFNKMVYQKSRLFEIYPHAIANHVSKCKMTAFMNMIGAWKLFNLQNWFKNVQ